MMKYKIKNRNKWFRVWLSAALLAAVLLSLGGCAAETKETVSTGASEAPAAAVKDGRENIYILYTNDVHCALEGNVSFSMLAAYKDYLEALSPYVALADCGDAIQGDAMGTVSAGEYPVEMMNRAGYDYAVLGNHEFDYGMERLSKLIGMADAQYLGCNLTYSGGGQSALLGVKPYAIAEYGDVSVALIGVSTPESITSSTPSVFMDENGTYLYGFSADDAESFYTAVQDNINECREKGADYVVLLTHLGIGGTSKPYRSTDLIAATEGVDAVLDGHSHSVIPCEYVKNREGEPVLLSSTGEKLQNIGQLVITPEGTLFSTLISDFPGEDGEMAAFAADIQSRYEDTLAEVVASTEVALTTKDSEGVRLVRSRETNLGDFCADAYRTVSGADIALVNGGGIRADVAAGEITYGDVIAVHPYGNTLCVAEATGQEILDCLEMGCRETAKETSDGDNAAGENGGFQQVSGLRFTIDTSVPSGVTLDKYGMFVSVDGPYRVTDAEVLKADGSYELLEPDKTYTVASHNYLIKEGGDGMNMFADNPLVIDEGMSDYQILTAYVKEHLGGVVGSDYEKPQGRIQVISGDGGKESMAMETAYREVPYGSFTFRIPEGFEPVENPGLDLAFAPSGTAWEKLCGIGIAKTDFPMTIEEILEDKEAYAKITKVSDQVDVSTVGEEVLDTRLGKAIVQTYRYKEGDSASERVYLISDGKAVYGFLLYAEDSCEYDLFGTISGFMEEKDR